MYFIFTGSNMANGKYLLFLKAKIQKEADIPTQFIPPSSNGATTLYVVR